MKTYPPISHDQETIASFAPSLMENSPNPILVIDPDNSIRYVNPAYIRLTGFSEEEIIGRKPPFPHWPAGSRKKYASIYADFTITRDEKQFSRKDGTLFWVEISAAPVLEDGKIKWHICHWTDITDRKRVEAELRLSEERFFKTFQGSPLILGISTAKDGRFLDVNEAFLQKMGYSREQVIGSTSRELGLWQDYGDRKKLINMLIKNGKVREIPVTMRTRDEHQVLFKANIETIEINKQACLLVTLEDITSRVKMEENLRTSEEKYRLLIENANEAIVVLQDGLIKFVNSSTLKMTGYSEAEMVLKPFSGFIYPADLVLAMRNHNLRLKNEMKVQVYELRIITKENQVKWAEINGAALLWEGKPATLNIMDDVTERKRAQEKWQRSERLLSLLAENAIDLIFRLRLEPVVELEYISPSALAFTGHSAEEHYKNPGILCSIRHDNCKNEYYEQMSTHSNKAREMRWIRKDGSAIWTEEKTNPFFNEFGQLVGIEGIVRDISGRKQAEATLEDETARRRILVDQSHDGIVVIDQTGKVYESNRRFAEMTGYSQEELLQLHVWDWENRVSQRDLHKMLDNIDEKGEYMETIHRRKDGTFYTVEISSNAAIIAGEKLIFCVCRDITERKKLEEKIMSLYEMERTQRQELEEEAKSRGMFIDVLAHELRTPLTPILASSSLLQEMSTKSQDAMLTRLSNNIHNSSQVLVERLEELLDVARYSRGAFKLKLQSTNVNSFVEGVITRFYPSLEEKNQRIHLVISANLPEVIFDRSRIEQVLINLLSNASKFAPQGDTTLEIKTDKDRLQFNIRDQGIGISNEEQVKIFQPYHRVEQDRQRFPGIGLGLNVCKHIVEAHGGEIGVTSDPGKGSTFSFWLPI
jgi:PAS domain S-box-containing protein